MKVLVLASKIAFKSTPSDEQLAEANVQSLFEITDEGVLIDCYKWFDDDVFEADLDGLYDFCTNTKLKLKGTIYVVKREDEESDPIQYTIKLGSKEATIEECAFNITVKRQGEKRKLLTIDEKLALYEEYYSKFKKQPPPKEVYKDFRIGAFYNTCVKNSEVMNCINDIEKGKNK